MQLQLLKFMLNLINQVSILIGVFGNGRYLSQKSSGTVTIQEENADVDKQSSGSIMQTV
jgi:hypothetical protein